MAVRRLATAQRQHCGRTAALHAQKIYIANSLKIAQCQLEEMPIITADNKIIQYPVDIIW